METLGERAKRLRTERGLSAAQLGHRAGIGENAVFKIEAGITKQPSFAVGVRLADALGISPHELAGLKPSPQALPDAMLEFSDGSIVGVTGVRAGAKLSLPELLDSIAKPLEGLATLRIVQSAAVAASSGDRGTTGPRSSSDFLAAALEHLTNEVEKLAKQVQDLQGLGARVDAVEKLLQQPSKRRATGG